MPAENSLSYMDLCKAIQELGHTWHLAGPGKFIRNQDGLLPSAAVADDRDRPFTILRWRGLSWDDCAALSYWEHAAGRTQTHNDGRFSQLLRACGL